MLIREKNPPLRNLALLPLQVGLVHRWSFRQSFNILILNLAKIAENCQLASQITGTYKPTPTEQENKSKKVTPFKNDVPKYR